MKSSNYTTSRIWDFNGVKVAALLVGGNKNKYVIQVEDKYYVFNHFRNVMTFVKDLTGTLKGKVIR